MGVTSVVLPNIVESENVNRSKHKSKIEYLSMTDLATKSVLKTVLKTVNLQPL